MKSRFVIIWTMKRSGSHAIVEWLKGHVDPEEFCFFNNMDIYGLVDTKRKCKIKEDHEIFMFSLEDQRIPKDKVVEEEIKRLDLHDKRGLMSNVILLRDPFNLLASRMRGWDPLFARNSVPVWKKYAKEFIRETQSLNNVLPVNFNSWFADEDYRRSLSKDLNLEFTDSGKDNLGAWGSSFDGKNFKTNASKMKVLDRWEYYKDNEQYIDLFDEEIISLSKRIFNFCPEDIVKHIK